jgi:hypothetical protein
MEAGDERATPDITGAAYASGDVEQGHFFHLLA